MTPVILCRESSRSTYPGAVETKTLEDIDGVVQGWASSVRMAPAPDEESSEQRQSDKPTPAQLDAERFQLHPSVEEWSTFTTRFSSLGSAGR